MRLDKYLCDCLPVTRNEIKKEIRNKHISVNDLCVSDPSIHVDPQTDFIMYKGKEVNYQKFHYYVLNKPAGYVTATIDKSDKTVMDLLPSQLRDDYFPVGRLDKDTEGLLLITNDGELSHRLLSPKYHVTKGYLCILEKTVTENDLLMLQNGIDIGDDKPTSPAKTIALDDKTVQLYITEGRYHQVKRMFKALCNKVTFLKRISFGPLKLDDFNILPGEYIELSKDKIDSLIK